MIRNVISKLTKLLLDEWVFIAMFIILNTTVILKMNAHYFSSSPLQLAAFLLLPAVENFFIATAFAALYRLPRMRWLKWLVIAVMSILFVAQLFIYFQFHIGLQASILTIIAETTPAEASGFFSTFFLQPSALNAIAITLLLLLVYILAEWQWAKRRERFRGSLFGKLLLLPFLAGAIAFVVCYLPDVARTSSADGTVHHNQTLLSNRDFLSTVVTQMRSISAVKHENDLLNATTEAYSEQPIVDGDRRLNVILVIGESYNKYHASLYGYYLSTTPYLEQELRDGCLVRLDNAVAAYNATSPSMKSMFSLNAIDRGERWCDCPLFPTVFKQAGYNVLFWDNQNTTLQKRLISDFAFTLNAALYSPAVVDKSYSATNSKIYDDDLELVDDFISNNTTRLNDGGNLAIIHLVGQHIDYNRRFPNDAKHKVFNVKDIRQKASYLDSRKRQIIADYDNATRYNDFVLHLLFDSLRDTYSVVVYLSDHGEEVYDYRDFMMRDRAPEKTPQMVKYENDIPMVVWFSPQARHLMGTLPDDVASRHFVNYDLPHLLLGLARVRSSLYRPERDLFSPAFKPHPRIIYDTLDYDTLVSSK